MLTTLLGVFIWLHGLVHLLYAGQSGRLFELRPKMTWPDNAWLPGKLFPTASVPMLASVLLVMATLGFITSGAGVLLGQGWQRPVTVGATVFSSLIFILFWDGQWKALDDQGGIGVLINLAILVIVLIV